MSIWPAGALLSASDRKFTVFRHRQYRELKHGVFIALPQGASDLHVSGVVGSDSDSDGEIESSDDSQLADDAQSHASGVESQPLSEESAEGSADMPEFGSEAAGGQQSDGTVRGSRPGSPSTPDPNDMPSNPEVPEVSQLPAMSGVWDVLHSTVPAGHVSSVFRGSDHFADAKHSAAKPCLGPLFKLSEDLPLRWPHRSASPGRHPWVDTAHPPYRVGNRTSP